MSGSISVTAVLGVGASSPHCYLLRVGEWSLLLDCGWGAAMDEAIFSPAACALIASVDCVLLSHSSFKHCGALPYIHRRLALSCPVYATLPVARMGAMTLYDHYQQHVAGISPRRQEGEGAEETAAPPAARASTDGEDELFSLDDVDAVFDSMRLLKYSEEMPLSDKLASATTPASATATATATAAAEKRLQSVPASSPSSTRVVISPHASGHSVGGCVWRIVCEGAVLLYAVDYNHSRERHLEGGLLEAFTRPSLLIMDCASLSPAPSLSVSLPQPPGTSRKARESRLLDLVLGCVNSGGVCLLPVDSACRVLELLALLHLTWEASRMYERVPLIFASPQAGTTVEFAQQQVEWLSDAMQKHLNTERTNPFHLPHLLTLTDMQQVDSVTQQCTRPAVILATSHSLQPNSIAGAVLDRIARQPGSLVLLTNDIEQGTVSSDLFTRAAQAAGAPFDLPIWRPMRVALEGEELKQHTIRAKVREEQRQMENNQQAATDGQHSDDDEDEDDDDGGNSHGMDGVVSAMHEPQHQSSKLLHQSSLLPPTNGNVSGNVPPSLVSTSTSSLSSTSHASSHLSASFPPFYQFPFSDPRRQSDLYGDMIEHHQSPQIAAAAGTQPSALAPPDSHRAVRVGHSAMSTPASSAVPMSFNSLEPPNHSATSPATSLHLPTTSAPSPPSAAPTLTASKCVWHLSSLAVLCAVSYVDFRGVSDARDWKNIVSHVKPRKLVLVHGQESEKASFRQYCIERQIGAAPPAPHTTGTATAAAQQPTLLKKDADMTHSTHSNDNVSQQHAGSDSSAMDVDSTIESSAAQPVSRSGAPSSTSDTAGVLVAGVMSPVDISSDLSYRFGMAPSLRLTPAISPAWQTTR